MIALIICLSLLFSILLIVINASRSNHTMHGLMPVSNGSNRIPMLPSNSRLLFIGDGWCESCREYLLVHQDAFLGSSYINILSAYYRRYFHDFNIAFYNRCIRGTDYFDFSNNLWKNDIEGINPDIVTLSFGMDHIMMIVNGKRRNDLFELKSSIEKVMLTLSSSLPSCTFIIVFPALIRIPRNDDNWDMWLSLLAELHSILLSIAQKFNILIMNMQDIFDTTIATSKAKPLHWVTDSDSLTPTDSGFHLVAEEWLRVLSQSTVMQSIEQNSLYTIRIASHSYSKVGSESKSNEVSLSSEKMKVSKKFNTLHWGVACHAIPKNSIVLFNGDSITDAFHTCGNGDSMGQGYAFLVSSYYSRHCPGRNVQFYNRGISGSRLSDQIESGSITHNLETIKPNIISWLIGINDIWFSKDGNFDSNHFENLYESVIAESVSTVSGVKIILMTPYVLPGLYTSENWTKWKSNVISAQDVVIRLGIKYKYPVINIQEVLDTFIGKNSDPTYVVFDGVHPTEAGYHLIAEKWLKVISTVWGS